jgi:nucleotide-binding universal stress UspA family protein
VEEKMEAPADWVQSLRITPEDLAADLDLPIPYSPGENGEQKPDGAVPIIDVEERAEKAAPAILRYAKDHDVDLIVMGTHGRRGVRRVLMGSVTEEVVRLSECPVFTVGGHETCDADWSIRRIVAPVDLSDHAPRTERHAAALAAVYGARLDLLYVIDEGMLPVGAFPIVGTAHVSPDEAERRAQDVLERHATDLEKNFSTIGDVGAVVRIGRPASEIATFAKEHEADLVVVGTHGRSGVERLLMGSVAEQVIRTAPCPAFTVKSFGRSLLPADAPARSDASAATASI